MSKPHDRFGARDTLQVDGQSIAMYRLSALEKAGLAPGLQRLPYSIKVLLESVLRGCDGFTVTEDDVKRLAKWDAKATPSFEVPFKPARVILQDFTGEPCLVDVAAMRAAVKRLGGDPRRVNPLVPVDLVVDHSVQVDFYGSADALVRNVATEFERNLERYEFLRWGQGSVQNFRVVPPATGIVHQVNLEYLATGIVRGKDAGGAVALPDSLVGTDSHTTMINGLGVVGWGVGGIEAEAVMLGQPLFMLAPQVIGMKLSGRLPEGVTATDLVLTVTQALRKKGVVDKFVEFFGPGVGALPLADRATVANMAPEYGATMGFFPVDAETLAYLRGTGRPAADVALLERYAKEQGLYRSEDAPEPIFTDVLELDLGSVEPSLAGPKRPQDRVPLKNMKQSFNKALAAPVAERGFGLAEAKLGAHATATLDGKPAELGHGAVVIAAITSCTNTSNPSVMLAAGLVARKAVARGLTVPAWVKTSLAPGSKVVTEYLREAGVLGDLEKLHFNLVGYGCTTCIGNSGPLRDEIAGAIKAGDLVAAAVLSGNRNFEGRVNPHVRANYLASPPLVVAYALAGTVDIDFDKQPLGQGSDGQPVFLRDVWPTQEEVADTVRRSITPAMFEKTYAGVFAGSPEWQAIGGASGDLYPWNAASTYIQEPPFFQTFGMEPAPIEDIHAARVLVMVGDSVTTDHISPAGDIAKASPAGRFLEAAGVQKRDFNAYGARRGNDRIMVRGTFANIRLKNLLTPGVEGGVTKYLPTGEQLDIFDAAEKYKADKTALLVIAGKEYGTGSSRDWAAKGTLLLGVRAVIAESYERIHRSNLVGMGVLPLEFKAGETPTTLGLTGTETFHIEGLTGKLTAKQDIVVRAVTEGGGSEKKFTVTARLDTPVDVAYYQNGGILQTVLRGMLKAKA